MTTFTYITPDEGQKIQAMRAAGSSISKISVALKRSQSGILYYLRRMAGQKIEPRRRSATPPKAKSVATPPAAIGRQSHGLNLKRFSGLVKCLGGCGGTFQSPDRMRIRICQGCKERQRKAGIPAAGYTLHL